MEAVKQNQEFHLGTQFSGMINIEILGLGNMNFMVKHGTTSTFQFGADAAYIFLTYQTIIDNGDFFEFVSFDPDKRELVVRINPNKKGD